ncbi:hypothetical protein RKE57_06150 [Stenotrophomonas geniculata]|uniref:hypothetical protein n=1 Tax=Stenotrophomonas geniculata TaxID=86188 RepID=UPI00287FA23F|nr:hypothetical protein [Stenotrophomonas geniculata]WNF11718.1 hypothetical protein RKE57_06150 [Stenotrophomonas geniculata]
MTKTRYVGFTVVGQSVTVVHADVPNDINLPIEIVLDATWPVQDGHRPEALNVLYQRCASSLKEHGAAHVVVKASALAQAGGTKLAHLESAECRGVVVAAAASIGKPVSILSKAAISKTYGNRKVDEYLKDDQFWCKNTVGHKLRKTSREAAMLIVAARNG